MSKIKIRQAEWKDIESLAFLFDCYRIFYAQKSDEGAADRTEKNYTNGIDRMRSILINRNQTMESTMVNFGQRQTAQSSFAVVSS